MGLDTRVVFSGCDDVRVYPWSQGHVDGRQRPAYDQVVVRPQRQLGIRAGGCVGACMWVRGWVRGWVDGWMGGCGQREINDSLKVLIYS